MRKAVLQRLFNSYRTQEIKLHELNYLFWEATLRCTLNCLHCGSDCKSDARIPDMPAKDFMRVLEELKNHVNPDKTQIVITGGEPTLRKDLPEIALQIRKMGYRWGMVTNGMLYNEELHKKFMHADMGSITVSLDGLEANHNWLRNSKLSFERAMLSIDLIRKEKRLNYDVVTCVNPRNIQELEELHQLLEEKELKAWRLFTIAPIGRAADNKEMLLSPQQLEALMEFIKEKRGSSSVDVKFSCEAWTGPYENEVRKGFFFCRAGVNIASILADGSISACPNIDRSFIQGNIYKDSFIEVWENKFQDMRDRKWALESSCANCREYKHCRGGAMHLWSSEKELYQCHYRDLCLVK